jgi:superfamily II DNA/RNA helicase
LVDVIGECNNRIAVYCESSEKAYQVFASLVAAGIACVRDITDEERVQFVTRAVRVMVCSDSRWHSGHVDGFVLHYDMPRDVEAYVARAGNSTNRKCASILFVRHEDRDALLKLERELQTTIDELPPDFNALLK